MGSLENLGKKSWSLQPIILKFWRITSEMLKNISYSSSKQVKG